MTIIAALAAAAFATVAVFVGAIFRAGKNDPWRDNYP